MTVHEELPEAVVRAFAEAMSDQEDDLFNYWEDMGSWERLQWERKARGLLRWLQENQQFNPMAARNAVLMGAVHDTQGRLQRLGEALEDLRDSAATDRRSQNPEHGHFGRGVEYACMVIERRVAPEVKVSM